MSGGLDSSVAAALLKRTDFNVIGVFLKLTDLPKFKAGETRAKKVAKILKVPLLVLDLKKEFKKIIINYFLDGYKKGITPNPCVVCNKKIKFGLLFKKTSPFEADYIATGHYIRKRKVKSQKSEIKNYKLLKAKDKNKDQSYFLWTLNQKQLKRILFPIGDYTRKEVEGLAKKFKLSFLLNIPKSTEICFIRTSINNFLKQYLTRKPGNIVDIKGKILGKHQGLAFYTIGQRKGIGLAGGPYWVSGKDLKKNLLIVTKNEKDLYKRELLAKGINWISSKEPRLPLRIKAKIRYRHSLASATIAKKIENKSYQVVFGKSQRAITAGQSVVFYKGERLLGGGIIC